MGAGASLFVADLEGFTPVHYAAWGVEVSCSYRHLPLEAWPNLARYAQGPPVCDNKESFATKRLNDQMALTITKTWPLGLCRSTTPHVIFEQL